MNTPYPQSGYALEKLFAAVKILATHQGHVKHRLSAASFDIFLLSPEFVPAAEGIREDIEWIQRKLNKEKTGVSATLRRMRYTTASSIAERIWNAYGKLEIYIDDEQYGFAAKTNKSSGRVRN